MGCEWTNRTWFCLIFALLAEASGQFHVYILKAQSMPFLSPRECRVGQGPMPLESSTALTL